MKVEGEKGKWWIKDVPPYEHRNRDGTIERFTDYGPYGTKPEAERIMRGLARTLKEIDRDETTTKQASGREVQKTVEETNVLPTNSQHRACDPTTPGVVGGIY